MNGRDQQASIRKYNSTPVHCLYYYAVVFTFCSKATRSSASADGSPDTRYQSNFANCCKAV